MKNTFENYKDFVDDKDKEILCFECSTWSLKELWKDCDVFCEDCGEHSGVRCPNCEHVFDSVWGYKKLSSR